MNCNNCGTQNNNENKFCVSCGIKLERKPEQIKKFCTGCGTENQLNNKFCINCGAELHFKQTNKAPINQANINKKKQPKHKQHKKYVQEKNFNLIDDIKKHKGATAAVLVVVGFLLFQVIPQEPEVRNVTSRFPQTNIPVNSGNTKLNEIASKFVCSCGNCGELSLETCTCPTAEEENALINTMLSQNLSTDEIVIAVANKYGWLKSEYYPQYTQLDKSKVWFGGTSQNLNNATKNKLLAATSFSLTKSNLWESITRE
jgi:hypothetical protein